MGIVLCEIGNTSDLLDETARQLFENLILEVFANAGATEHSSPQIFWGRDETVAVFRANAKIEPLVPLNQMPSVDSWRTVDPFVLTVASEHGPHKDFIVDDA